MMDTIQLADHPLVNALGWTLLHFVWEGALLGLAAYIVLRAVRPAAASTRYLIGVGALAALLFAPILTFLSIANEPSRLASTASWQSRPPSVSAGGLITGSIIADMPANPSATHQLIPPGTVARPPVDASAGAPAWLPLVTATWMLGVLVLSLRLLGGWVLTRMLARQAIAAVSPVIDTVARDLAVRLDLQRAVEILESAAVSVPTLIGWVRPVVLLPTSALSGLSPMQLEAILAHELAHVRRHDYLINVLQCFVETLLFYHPAVWWVSSEVRAERENCCDDLAVAVCGDRLVYVSALAELTSIERKAFALAATDGSLLTRVRRILGRPVARRELPPSWGILALVALLGGGAGTYEITTAAADQPPVAPPALADRSRESAEQDRGTQEARRIQEAAEALTRAEEMVRAKHDQLLALEDAQRDAEASRAAALALFLQPPAPAAPVAPVAPVAPAPFAPVAPVPFAPVAPTLFAPVPRTPAPAPPAPVALFQPPTPPAPPASPAPPAPPAPPEFSIQRGEGNFTWSNNWERVSVKWTGPFRLTDDERDIAWIEEGARVTISDGWVFTDRAELRGLAGGKVERNFYSSGFKKDWETDGRPFLVNAIARMIRSGMFASDRVARFLKQGGPDAVVAEIDRLQSDSSHLKRVYYSALLKQADLTPTQLQRVLDGVAHITSDHDKGTLFAQILQEGNVSDEQRIAVARAVRSISSDHEKRKVLTMVVAREPVSESVAAAAIDAATAIGSSHDRSTVLVELARKGAVTPRSSAPFMAAITGMSSSHDQRRVLAALAGSSSLPEHVALEAVKASGAISSSHDQRQALAAYMARADATPKVAAAALASARHITSSHDKAEVLLEVVRRGGLSDESSASFFGAATTISSSHDLSRVLQAVAARPNLSDGLLAGLLRAAGSIISSHDRATLLLEILKAHALSPSARQLFLDTAQGISSSHDQNRVLAELVRSERRGR